MANETYNVNLKRDRQNNQFPWLKDYSGSWDQGQDSIAQQSALQNALGWTPGTGQWFTNDEISQMGAAIEQANTPGGFDLGSLIPGADMVKGIGAGIQGIGNLARGWAALKNVGLGKDTLNFQKSAYLDNASKQAITLNNRLRDRNMYKQKTMKPGGYQLDKLLPVDSKYLG